MQVSPKSMCGGGAGHKVSFLRIASRPIQQNKVIICVKYVDAVSRERDIDPLFVCSYNTIMKITSTGFFRPDHDPPQYDFLELVILSVIQL